MTERLSDTEVWLVTALCPSCEWEPASHTVAYDGNVNRLWQARNDAADGSTSEAVSVPNPSAAERLAALLDLAQRLATHAAHMPACTMRPQPHTCNCGLDQLLGDTIAAGIYVQPHTPTRPAPHEPRQLPPDYNPTKGDG